MTLQINGGNDLPVAQNGSFVFRDLVPSGTAFDVTISKQPTSPSQACIVSNGHGSVSRSNINDLAVTCTTLEFAVGGTVTGLSGFGLGIRDTDNVGFTLAVTRNGAFELPLRVKSGARYSATVVSQPVNPSQTCELSNGSGTVGSAPVTSIQVTCTTSSYSVGGSVAGLTGAGLVLRLNGGPDMPVGNAGTFMFPAPLVSGSSYNVTVATQPAARRELCSVTNASGTIGAGDVTNVQVDCTVALGFVYSVNAATGNISTYGINPGSGALIAAGSLAPTGGKPTGLVATPTGTFLYAANSSSSTISTFSIAAAHGELTAVGAPFSTGTPGGQWSQLAMAPSGRFLYLVNGGSHQIAILSIDSASGSLSVAGAPVSFTGGIPLGLVTTPDGKHLYLLSGSPGNSLPAVLLTYAVDGNTGLLTAGAAITLTDSTSSIAMDPLGRFLYISDWLGDASNALTAITPYAIDPASGALAASGTAALVASNGAGLVLDPSGRFAYDLNNFNFTPADNNVVSLSVDQATETLTPIGVPAPNLGDAGLFGSIVSEPSGRFIFVANVGSNTGMAWNDLSSYAIEPAPPTMGQLDFVGFGVQYPADVYARYVVAQVAVVE